MGLASGVAVLEFPSDNSPTVLVEVHTRNMLSNKPSIGVLRTFHEITHRCTLIPRCWTATGQWEFIKMGNSNIDELEKLSTAVLVRICVR